MKNVLKWSMRESRAKTYGLAARVWLPVAAYAVAHDQYVVRIEPRHFTVYHDPVPGVTSPEVQAAILAFQASFLPGFMLGFACVIVAWAGDWPRLPERFVLPGVLIVIVLSELCSLLSWRWVRARGSSFYPDFIFPDDTLGIITTQTIQITCYAASAVFSVCLLTIMALCRYRFHRRIASSGGT